MHNLGVTIDCCLTENKIKYSAHCQMVIENLPDDPVYGVHNKTCTPAFRSLTSRNYSCPLYPTTFVCQIFFSFTKKIN